MPTPNRTPDQGGALARTWIRAILFAGAMLPVAAVADGAEPLGASFQDDFDTFDVGRWFVSDGWSNGAHQNCQWSASAVSHFPGRLTLEFRHDPTPTHSYRCGEIQSHQRYSYGTYEARIKAEEASGLNAAFFTYIGPVHGERHDEIDFEILTAQIDRVSVNTYVDGQPLHGGSYALPPPADAGFNVYSFIWEPNRMRWFVDGELIKEVKDVVLPERPQKIYLSLWGTETLNNWMGPFVHPEQPKRMEIDWVAYTAPGEQCQFDGSVLCQLAED